MKPLGAKASRADPSKPLFSLVPPESTLAVANILTFGSRKYGPRNWEQGIPHSELVDATMRHLHAYLLGEDLDAESSLPHLWHALTNLSMLVALSARRPDLDFPRGPV